MPQRRLIQLGATLATLTFTAVAAPANAVAALAANGVAAPAANGVAAPTTGVAARAGVTWSADVARSSVSLSVSELLFSRVRGTIAVTSATIVTPAATSVPQRVTVTLAADSIATGDPQRNADLRSGKFFDTARYPTITFASDRILGTNPADFTILGNLTIRGISRPVSFDAHVAATSTDPSGKQHVRYVATGSFRRSDYGITYARGVVGDTVALNVVIDAVD